MAVRYLTLSGIKKLWGTALQVFSGGEGVVATGLDGFIHPSFIQGSGTLAIEASENLANLDAVNIHEPIAGDFRLRKADASAFTTQADGFVSAAWLLGEVADVLTNGKIGGFPATTFAAGPIFLDSATAGGVIQTDPTAGATPGDVWQVVATAIDDTTLEIKIGEAIEL